MNRSNRTAGWLALVVVGMVSLSFAAVPFYRWFCQVTGYAGTPSVSQAPADAVSEQSVVVRFDASLDRDMPWTFRPQQVEMTLLIGQTGLAFYEAHNPTDRPVAGQATFNVTPDLAGGYFTKIACFCFEEQVLQPGETVVMPVTFYVDPAILQDPEASRIKEITLSYTFYEIPLPQTQAALEPGPAKPVN